MLSFIVCVFVFLGCGVLIVVRCGMLVVLLENVNRLELLGGCGVDKMFSVFLKSVIVFVVLLNVVMLLLVIVIVVFECGLIVMLLLEKFRLNVLFGLFMLLLIDLSWIVLEVLFGVNVSVLEVVL